MSGHGDSCVATVAEGRLRGVVRNGIRCFLGIPYAAPPVGENRFRAPQPPPAWEGERNAAAAGATAPHSVPRIPGLDLSSSFAPGWVEGDDYLTLNVWRPDDGREQLPVFVYIHGGGFINGSKDIPIIDGSAFARDGIVAVAINYRLGAEGFLPVPGAPTNLGLRDQIAALAWIRRNIHHFGGDPGQVTVGGESAGAASVGCLLASPKAKGLFRRAILQSGAGAARELEPARRVVAAMAKRLKVAADVEGFRGASHRATVKAQDRIALAIIDTRNANGADPAFGLSKFIPVLDDDIVPAFPQQAIARGAGAEVDLLICTCRDETNTWTVPLAFHIWLFPMLARKIFGWFHRRSAEILGTYGLGRRGSNSGQVFSRAFSDLVFRWPSRLLAEQHQGRAHVMEYDWPSPAMGGRYGAAHGSVVPFIFDTLAAATGPRRILGIDPPQALADRYHGAWAQFVKGEVLPWPAFDSTGRSVYSLVRGAAGHEPRLPVAAYY